MANQNIGQEWSIIGVAIASVIAVTTSSGGFDLLDTISGIILLFVLWPFLRKPKSNYFRGLISIVTGLCLLLVVGVAIEILRTKIFPHAKYQILPFVFWILLSLVLLLVIPSLKKNED